MYKHIAMLDSYLLFEPEQRVLLKKRRVFDLVSRSLAFSNRLIVHAHTVYPEFWMKWIDKCSNQHLVLSAYGCSEPRLEKMPVSRSETGF